MLTRILSAIALTPFLLSGEMEKGEEPICSSPFHTMHVGVRHTEARGVGYKEGYTTLEGFGIYDGWPSFMPFLDLRGHVFNSGKVAGNIGIGERSVIPSIDHIFGLYLYYDTRQSDHGLKVNQLSPGLELLGERMEYRVNGYFPVGKHEGHKYGSEFNKFSGHQIILQSKRKYAMSGWDGEVGVHATQSTRNDFYLSAGPYYFTSDPSSAWGAKARVYWRYKEYVSLEASYTYDHLFKSIVQGTATLSYPFGPKLKRKGTGCPNPEDLGLSRAAFAPNRFEIPVIRKKRKRDAAINPATGQPWQVWFVNNTSNSKGTFESPFPMLVLAQTASSSNDVIYVFPGDGTEKGLNAGIVLQQGQQLLGAGISHPLNTTNGTIIVPAQASGLPVISNSHASNDVTIELSQGNNTVSGIYVFDAIGNNRGGIVILSGENYLIANNNFSTFSFGNCVLIAGGGNQTIIENNTFKARDSINAGGIFIGSTGTIYPDVDISGNILIRNNIFGDLSSNTALLTGILAETTTISSELNISSLNNQFYIGESTSSIFAIIDVENISGRGNMCLFLEDNFIEASKANLAGLAGVLIQNDAASIFNASLIGNVSNTSNGPGYLIQTTGSGSLNLYQVNNQGTLQVSGNVQNVISSPCSSLE